MGRKRKIGITIKVSNSNESVEVYTPSLKFEEEAAILVSKIIEDREERMERSRGK